MEAKGEQPHNPKLSSTLTDSGLIFSEACFKNAPCHPRVMKYTQIKDADTHKVKALKIILEQNPSIYFSRL